MKCRISSCQENWDLCAYHIKLNYTGSLLWYVIIRVVSPAPICILHIFYRQCINILQAFCCIQRKKANGGQWDSKSCKLVIAESSAKLAVDTKTGWENKAAYLLQHYNYPGCRINFRWASWLFSLGLHIILGLTFCGMNCGCWNEPGKTCDGLCLGDHHPRRPLTTAGAVKRRARIIFPLFKPRRR